MEDFRISYIIKHNILLLEFILYFCHKMSVFLVKYPEALKKNKYCIKKRTVLISLPKHYLLS